MRSLPIPPKGGFILDLLDNILNVRELIPPMREQGGKKGGVVGVF
jgi:hypothetical protein